MEDPMGIADDIADKLAADVIAYVERSGDEELITKMAQTLGDQSQTLQEAFVTSVRVQRAAIRANRMLQERLARFDGREAPPVSASASDFPTLPGELPVDQAVPEPSLDSAKQDTASPAAPEPDVSDPERPEADGTADDDKHRPSYPVRANVSKRKPPVPTVGASRPKFG
jgi:hypothetical protein